MKARVYERQGQTVFVHECERRRHALTVGWSAPIYAPDGRVLAYPALDENSVPPCPGCGGAYERVPPCPNGPHDCHPIAGHVERSDDHASGLAPEPDPDRELVELQELRLRRWAAEQRHLISELEKRLEDFDYPADHERLADQLALAEARRALRQHGEATS